MKKLSVLILLMLAAGPVAAQDEAAATPGAEETSGFGTTEEVGSAAPTEGADAASEPADAAADAAAETGEAPVDAAAEPAADAVADAAAAEPAADAAVDAAAEAPAEVSADAPAEAPAEASADAAIVEESVAVEEVAEATDDAAGDSAESAAVGESEPWQLYIGTDYVSTRAKFSSNDLKAEFGGEDFDSSMLRGRVGMRLFEKIGLEVQFGAGKSDDLEADEYNTEQFYGAYLVPTGVLFDLIEIGASIGYAHTKLETATASETLSGVSFGVNLDIPLYASEAVELRIGGGGSMFRAQNSAQIAGYYAGIRVDFRI